jgi:uncharacterized membrane protein YhaH (DUF805 family)
MAYQIEPNTKSHRSFYYYSQPVLALLILCFITIAIGIAYSNKGNLSIIFKKLSTLPLLVIASHIPFMLIGKPFSDLGGWWILYALIAICIPLSLILYGLGIGFTRQKQGE